MEGKNLRYTCKYWMIIIHIQFILYSTQYTQMTSHSNDVTDNNLSCFYYYHTLNISASCLCVCLWVLRVCWMLVWACVLWFWLLTVRYSCSAVLRLLGSAFFVAWAAFLWPCCICDGGCAGCLRVWGGWEGIRRGWVGCNRVH